MAVSVQSNFGIRIGPKLEIRIGDWLSEVRVIFCAPHAAQKIMYRAR